MTAGRRLVRLLFTVFAFSSAVSAAVGLVSYFAIPVLFGRDYLQSVPLVPVLAAAAAFYGANYLGVALAAVLGLPRWASVVNGIGAVVGLGAYLILIPMFGPLGAAIGSLASYAASGIATAVLCLTRRHLRPSE